MRCCSSTRPDGIFPATSPCPPTSRCCRYPEMPGAERHGEHLAVHARDLTVQPHLPKPQGYRQSLLPPLEPADARPCRRTSPVRTSIRRNPAFASSSNTSIATAQCPNSTSNEHKSPTHEKNGPGVSLTAHSASAAFSPPRRTHDGRPESVGITIAPIAQRSPHFARFFNQSHPGSCKTRYCQTQKKSRPYQQNSIFHR